MLNFSIYTEIILYLFEYIVLYYVFSNIFERRLKKEYLNYVLIIGLIAINLFIDHSVGLISGPAMFIKMALVFLTYYLIFNGVVIRIIVLAIVCFIAMGVSDYLAAIGLSSVIGTDNFSFIQDSGSRLVFGIISKLIFLVTAHLLMTRFRDVRSMDPRKLYRIILVLLINIAFIVLAGEIYFKQTSALVNDLYFAIGVLLGIVLITLLVVKMTESIITYSMRERDWQLQEEEYRRQIFYLNHIEDINDQMKSIRHDFNHHIGCIYGMLEQGKIEPAKDYVADVVENANLFNIASSTEYPGISGLLSSKYNVMIEHDIEFNCKVDLPEVMSIKIIDLSIVLGNALDNAIEACMDLHDQKSIDLNIYTEMDYVVIKIKNSFNEQRIKENYRTTKDDAKNHGYGLKNIKFVVEKYDGIFKINSKNGEFLLNVAIPYETINVNENM